MKLELNSDDECVLRIALNDALAKYSKDYNMYLEQRQGGLAERAANNAADVRAFCKRFGIELGA
jgi:hypothetical protein